MEQAGAPTAADAVDMHFGLAHVLAGLMVRLVRRGALMEADVAEILVDQERLIGGLLEEGDFQAVLALSSLHETMRSDLDGKIELARSVEQLQHRLGRPEDMPTPRDILAMNEEQWRQLMTRHRNQNPD